MSEQQPRWWGASLAGRGRWWSRPAWSLVASGALWAVTLAALLEPAPEGVGTHTQLGLAPCTFLVVTGYPCPSCGLTTAFSHMMRFQIIDALNANGPGVVMFLVTLAMVPISLVGMVRDLPVLETLSRLRADIVAVAIAAASLLAWGIEIALMILGPPG